MRLLVFHPALAPYRVDFFNMLAERFDLRVVFQAENLTSQSFDQEKLRGMARFDYAFFRRSLVGRKRKLSLGYARFIRRFRPDIVMGSEYGTNLAIPYLLRPFFRKRYRLWTMTDDNVDFSEHTSRIRRWMRAFFAPRLDGIVCANGQTLRWMEDRFPLRAGAVVPIIADERVLRRQMEDGLPQLPSMAGQYRPAGSRLALFVGRLHPVKNLHALVEALSLLPDPVRLALVGSGPEEESLRLEAAARGLSGRVTFAGRWEAPALYGWYQLADVFVLPSTYELFGAVVGEALQAGCPVVCSAVAGAADLIRPGDNGEVVDPESAESVAEGIRRVLERTAEHPLGQLRPSLMDRTLEEDIDLLTEKLYGKDR